MILHFCLHTLVCLVGPSGLEPPTSCLSGTRSNHLSYEPVSWMQNAECRMQSAECRVQNAECRIYSVHLSWLRTLVRWWRWWDSNPWPPACRAGALPAELHPHIVAFGSDIASQWYYFVVILLRSDMPLALVFAVSPWKILQNWTMIRI